MEAASGSRHSQEGGSVSLHGPQAAQSGSAPPDHEGNQATTPARMLRQIAKTDMCRYAPHCRHADRCRFAHSQSELRCRPDLTKTSLCASWAAGECALKSEDCAFAHGRWELKVTQAFLDECAKKENKKKKKKKKKKEGNWHDRKFGDSPSQVGIATAGAPRTRVVSQDTFANVGSESPSTQNSDAAFSDDGGREVLVSCIFHSPPATPPLPYRLL